jgi:hypothetical protein
MSKPDTQYWLIPEYFSKQCDTHWFPLDSVVSDTQGFVNAIVAFPDSIMQIYMRRYLERGNYLFCYLRTKEVSPKEAWRIAKEVLEWLKEADIPLSYRSLK